ncbi:YihY/virulence factor BrkB family protein [Dehalogenimonas etheniformans]|uniref:YihY/virulence factor BrkB family protein n=1 Tax=Dehalogenimonas etheniformans TaxID=1536648 RepID=A0A2P5P5A3_9CHLR|nr:YihY/virulence factor BrkB family protein [Dehalogenimonas etheniformans]PPD57471.1 YihY/virulence factor BrkB family protein [Dehalogenimonas etheniformans]QNT76834.1 YihY/virulence factor BrkB family protein [Dehalogenimonas etheniformans]
MTIKQTIAKLKKKYNPAYERWLAKPFIQLIVRIANQAGNTAAGDLAGNVSFNIILSILPLFFGALALFAYFFNTADVQTHLINYFSANFPSLVDNLQSNLDRVDNAKAALGLVGALGSVWTGINVFGSLDDAVNRAWGVKKFRPLFHAKLVELGMAIGCGLLFLVSIGFSTILEFFPNIALLKNHVVQGGGYVISFGLMFMLFSLMYKIFPNVKTTWREVFPGAIFAAVAFELARQLFFAFAGNSTRFEVIYGSLSTMVLFITWVYYASMVAIIGAIFTVEYNALRKERLEGNYHVIKPGESHNAHEEKVFLNKTRENLR